MRNRCSQHGDLELTMDHAYPADLARFVLERLQASGVGSDRETLVRILSTAYQASLLREEERPLTFRLLVAPPELLPLEGGPPRGHHRLRFDHPRALDEQEVRRLAPAAKMQRAMIGVFGETSSDLRIWGLIQTGPGWLHAIQGGRARSAPMPDALSVAVTAPGRILVSRGGVTIAKLAGGQITGRIPEVFDSQWLSDACAENRRDVRAAYERVSTSTPAFGFGPGILRRLDQQLLRRIIANVRLSRHGGTLVIVPHEEAERIARSEQPVALKYEFADEEPRRRYRSLQIQLLAALADDASRTARTPTWETYVESTSPELVRIDEALLELAHTISGLADVDGAVVMNKRFEVIGFGGEIVGDLPVVARVMRACDLEGDTRVEERTDRVGTRHRSVYRLCAAMPDAIGIVVSQDGSVRLVANKDGAVTYWNQLGTGPMEI